MCLVSDFSGFKSYGAIAQPHKIVHKSVIDNFKLTEDIGLSSKNATKLKNNFENMEDASVKLFGLLDDLIAEEKEEVLKNCQYKGVLKTPLYNL
jgi:hypothetical protein